jgi:protein TonB
MAGNERPLRLDDKVRGEDLLYAAMAHGDDRKIMWWSVGIALLLHVIVIFVHLPSFGSAAPPPKPENVIVVKRYVPPPPKVERKQIVQKKITRKVPLPDPTPDEPEPIREPEPEIIEEEPIPADVDFLIGVPEPPPPSGPLIAGVGDVTNPVLIESTKVQPEYPELARVARLEGNVILQAIIHADGTVGDLQILRCNRPGMGFEDAAVQAVRQWQYHPAKQGDRPVEVYFTVYVEFTLH